jgi:hypothetical protein
MIAAYKTETGQLVGVYSTALQASEELGVENSAISRCISGKLRSTRGYCFLSLGKDFGTLADDAQDYVRQYFSKGFSFNHYAHNMNAVKCKLPVPKVLNPQGKWRFERGSGYAGYRCQRCGVWVYANQPKICDCDK